MSDDSYSDRLKNTKRNDPCPCGSGRKYKKCHLEQDETALHAAARAAKAAAESAAASADAEPAATKKETASSAERATARQNKPARGAAGNPRPKNLPRRKAV